MRRTKVVRLLGAALGLLLAASTPSYAETRHAALIVDANTGKVLHEQYADESRHPASLTKMMTLYLVFEEIAQGRLSYDTKISVSAKAAAVAPSKLDLEVGDQVDLIDAIKALITKSANDMAVAVAERIAGSEPDFVRLMNDTARRIGMRKTTFTNASGLPDPRQVTTARDMVTLGLRLQDDFPRFYPLFALRSFDFRGKTYRTHNTLLHGFPGMDGIKTGYTRASGFNLVSSVRSGKKHLVGAVFGGVTANARNAHMRMQLFHALEKASSERTRQSTPKLVARAAPVKHPAPEPVKSEPAKPEAVKADNEAGKPAPKTAAAARQRPAPPQEAAPSPSAGTPTESPPQVASEPAKGPDIAVLKVRPVTILPQPAAEPAPAVAPPAASAVTPKLDLQAFREAISSQPAGGQPASAPAPSPPPSSIEDIISAAARPEPPAAGQQLAMAGDGSFAEPSPQSMRLGRQPSTLDAQAARIAPAPDTKPLAPLKPAPKEAPVRFSAVPVGNGYLIQIGAYSSQAEAESRIAAARSRATGLLEGHRSMTVPVQKAERQIFRARFADFGEDAAGNACLELRRLAIDCFVMKAD